MCIRDRNSTGNLYIHSETDDSDIVFTGEDGSSGITALTLDMSDAGAATFNSKITASGTSVFTNLDISGNVDIDGTTNLDAVDIDGAVQVDNTITVGVDDTGYDVKFFGDTASAYMLWDTSADDLILAGAARVVVPASGLVIDSTAVSATAAELNIMDGSATTQATVTIADGDGVVISDVDTMKQCLASDFVKYICTSRDRVAVELSAWSAPPSAGEALDGNFGPDGDGTKVYLAVDAAHTGFLGMGASGDGSGVDPSCIEVYLDGVLQTHKYTGTEAQHTEDWQNIYYSSNKLVIEFSKALDISGAQSVEVRGYKYIS